MSKVQVHRSYLQKLVLDFLQIHNYLIALLKLTRHFNASGILEYCVGVGVSMV